MSSATAKASRADSGSPNSRCSAPICVHASLGNAAMVEAMVQDVSRHQQGRSALADLPRFTGGAVGFIVIALFMPLISLIQGLT